MYFSVWNQTQRRIPLFETEHATSFKRLNQKFLITYIW